VRKVLDAADVQGERDMSGFGFDVRAGNGESIGRLTTGADGRTPTIDTTGGTYTITEVARPTWADGLIDAGPITFEFEPTEAAGDANDPLESDIREVTYTNIVPSASITTAASDADDGDQVVDLALGDATIVDTVTHTALVPGTEYTVTGELMVAGSADAVPEMIGAGIVASTTFVPIAPDGTVDVVFTVPGDSPLLGHVVVVYQYLSVAASGRIVAEHADPDAIEQTIRFTEPVPTPETTTTPPATTPDTTAPAPTTTTITTTTPSTTTPSATTFPTTTSPPPPERSLPRTGGNGSRPMAAGGLAILLLGLALLLATVRAPIRHHPGSRARSDV